MNRGCHPFERGFAFDAADYVPVHCANKRSTESIVSVSQQHYIKLD
jgi:hypothetical protein